MIEFTTELFLIVLSMALSFGISILIVVMPYLERSKAAAIAAAALSDRERMKQALIYTALDYDFARDLTAGQETTRYNDMMRIIRSARDAEGVPAGCTCSAAGKP